MRTPSLKNRLRDLLREGDLEGVGELAMQTRRVLGSLVALTFEPEPRMGWRAIEAMGISVERMAPRYPAYVREHVRRLYWLITEESGAVFWRAPECLAECCAREPDLLQNHIPIAFHLIETLEEEDLEHFRPGALWAIARLADLARPDLPGVLPLVLDALNRADPQARGMAVWCLGRAGELRALEDRPQLLTDPGPVQLYRNRDLEETTVGRLTREFREASARRI